MTSELPFGGPIFIACAIIVFIRFVIGARYDGILDIIEQLFFAVIFSLIMAFIITFILYIGYPYIVNIYESGKIISLILTIITVALLGYVEVRIIFWLINLSSVLEMGEMPFLSAILGNIGIGALINRLFGPLDDLFIPNTSHGVLNFLVIVFLVLASGWAAVFFFIWEGWREEEARETGVIVQPGAGIIIGAGAALIGLYLIYKAAMAL